MNKIEIKTKEQLDELEQDSALTWEGLDTSDGSLKEMFDWIKKYTEVTENVYIISGALMNVTYGLTGTNAYPKDLHIVSVKLSDMKEPMKVAIPRLQVGGRWFDDIVDNNRRREDREG